ncbi:hypothetical protein GOP47_0001858 [Adiantum capillus-veneris]|uniref:Kinesin light chain n=1 Tax=Adiantum capillus-veneris TaxID=13818 RepID=A0A9D4V9U3_ADICA|nr:hypothetical protein GOP47_0001858 [Adiantum capillus-veneris]
MPSVDSNGPLLFLQQNNGNFYGEGLSVRRYTSPGSLQNYASESTQQEIVEAHMDDEYDEEDAAFCAEAEAFARKCDVHELAVKRLVEDLVEDDELEASAKLMSVPNGGLESSSVVEASEEASKEGNNRNSQEQSEVDEAADMASSPYAHIENTGSKTTATCGNDRAERNNSAHGDLPSENRTQHQANKRSGGNQNGKNSHHPVSKKRIQHVKLASHEKTSSRSPPSNNCNSPNPTSDRKLASKPGKVHANSVSSKRFTQEESKGQCLTENETTQSKVKEFARSRKPATGIDRRRALRDDESAVSSEFRSSNASHDNLESGPSLFKMAKRAIASGDKPQKALEYAMRAAKAYETAADGKPSLDLVMCLHVLAALHSSLGQFDEAVTVLENSLNMAMLKMGGQEHALAAFAGYMQLGDTLALTGKGEESLAAYCTGLEVQMGALGEKDPRVGETCRYLAEAHAQALQFDKAEELCQQALAIHKEHSVPASIEEATDRRLMGLIYNGKGQHEAALEQLVLASMALISNGRAVEVAAVDASIGDTYVLLGRLDEAVISYQKALKVLKASKGENHVAVASLYISLAQLYFKTGKLRESRAYCESALRIYTKQGGGHSLEEVATGLTEMAIIYESLNERELALSFLQKALAILETAPGQQSAVAGVEAQIGVFHYLHGNYADARDFFGKALSKLKASAEKNSPLFGIVLNQMGLACVQLSDIQMAVDIFEESRAILEAVCGLHHPDTLSVYSNLAGAYDALGRLDDAIAVLQYTLEAREDMHGLEDMEAEDERARLAELLKEAGRPKTRRYHSILDSTLETGAKC